MNQRFQLRRSCRTLLGTLAGLAIVAHGAEPRVVRSVESVNGAEIESRSQVLFLGTLITVKDDNGTWHQINSASGNSFAEQQSGRIAAPVEVTPGAFEFTYDRALKLAAGQIELSQIEVTPGFSPARDPSRRWLQAQSLAASGAMDQARSASLRAGAEVAVGRSLQSVASNPNLNAAQKEQSTLEIKGSSASQTSEDSSIPTLGMGDNVEVDGREGDLLRNRDRATDRNAHDAVEIRFVVTALQDLDQPCALVYAEFFMPGVVRRHRRVFVEALPPFEKGDSRSMRIWKTEFPVGYTELTVQISFFDRGLELATNTAERRTPLTRTEARQFAVLEHLSRHRDLHQSADAELVREFVDQTLRDEWAEWGRDCFVSVNPDGVGEAIFEDAMGLRPIADPSLSRLVEQLAFRPAATSDGRPLTGMVNLKAGSL